MSSGLRTSGLPGYSLMGGDYGGATATAFRSNRWLIDVRLMVMIACDAVVCFWCRSPHMFLTLVRRESRSVVARRPGFTFSRASQSYLYILRYC